MAGEEAPKSHLVNVVGQVQKGLPKVIATTKSTVHYVGGEAIHSKGILHLTWPVGKFPSVYPFFFSFLSSNKFISVGRPGNCKGLGLDVDDFRSFICN